MALISLLERVPALLEACIEDTGDFSLQRSSNIQILRLVSKDSSRYALSAVKVFSLKLMGQLRDTNIAGTRLLQQTHLYNLQVRVSLSGEC